MPVAFLELFGAAAAWLFLWRRVLILCFIGSLLLLGLVCRLNKATAASVAARLGSNGILRDIYLVLYPLRLIFMFFSWPVSFYWICLGSVFLTAWVFPRFLFFVGFLYQEFWDAVARWEIRVRGRRTDSLLAWVGLVVQVIRLKFATVIFVLGLLRLLGLPLLPDELYVSLATNPTVRALTLLWFFVLYILALGSLILGCDPNREFSVALYPYASRLGVLCYWEIHWTIVFRLGRWLFHKQALPGPTRVLPQVDFTPQMFWSYRYQEGVRAGRMAFRYRLRRLFFGFSG